MDGSSRKIGPLFIGSEIYRGSSYGPRHPLRVPRVSTVIDLSRALGLLSADRYRTSPRAKAAALTLWHDPDYIAALARAEAEGAVSAEVTARHGLGTLSNPVFPEMFRRPATGAGGVMLAADLLAAAVSGAVHVPGGGTHHGLRDRANGFCYLNDPVLGILKSVLTVLLVLRAFPDRIGAPLETPAKGPAAAQASDFRLDDSLAMGPGMGLSSAKQVVVGARISRSGNAMPQSGDLFGRTVPLANTAQGVRLVIDQVVP